MRLIALYKDNIERLTNKDTKKKAIWSDIAATLKAEGLYSVSFLGSLGFSCLQFVKVLHIVAGIMLFGCAVIYSVSLEASPAQIIACSARLCI